MDLGNSTRKVNDDQIAAWRRFAATQHGVSEWGIARKIKDLGCRFSRNTIWKYLSDENRLRANECNREYRCKSETPRKYAREYQRKRRRQVRPWEAQSSKGYQKAYRRLSRASAQPKLLTKLHADHPDATWTLESMTEAIKPYVENVAFRPETVRKRLIEPYQESCRGPPYIKREGDRYGLSDEPSGRGDMMT